MGGQCITQPVGGSWYVSKHCVQDGNTLTRDSVPLMLDDLGNMREAKSKSVLKNALRVEALQCKCNMC